MRFKRLFSLVLVLTVISAAAQAIDSPWPKFRQNQQNTGATPYSGPGAPAVKWTFQANDGIACSPSIGEDGTLYVGAGWYYLTATDSNLYAINRDGSLKWKYNAGGGIFSSPAIGPDGAIYFGTLKSSVLALEDSVTYGKLRWSTALPWQVYSSPILADDGTIYVGCLNFGFYALNSTGAIKWSYFTDWCVFSSPAIGPAGEIYVGSKDHNLYCFEDSLTYGKVKWTGSAGTFYEGYLMDSSPAFGPDGTLYIGTDPYGAAGRTPVPVDSVFFAFNPDGSLKWKFPMLDGAEGSPAIGSDGMIYIGSYDGNFYAIRDAGTEGVAEWVFPTGGAIDGSATVDGNGTIYFGSRDSTLYALNPDGSVQWSYHTAGEIESSPTIDDQGILYIGDLDGYLYAFGADGPDVGVASLDMPAEILSGRVHLPRATVKNYRIGSESFGVACVIDTSGQSIYGDTLFVSSLDETTTYYVNFAPWNVAPDTGVVYNVTITTLHGTDNNIHNNILSATIRASDDLAIGAGCCPNDAPPIFTLGQSYPNPFSASTRINFSIGEAAHVSLKVYNLAGQRIRTLVDEQRPQGYHPDVVWNGRDDNGMPVSSGIYFYKLVTKNFTKTRKMVLLK